MAETMTGRATTTALGGSMLEIITGVGAVVLAILGLFQIAPLSMGALATILAGAALMFEGAAVGARTQDTMALGPTRRDRAQLGGTRVEVIGGITGVVLGVLALLRVIDVPFVLIAAGNVVFGAALIIGSAGVARVNRASLTGLGSEEAHRVEQTGKAASGTELLVGIGAVTLGVLALLEIEPVTLSLVALLAVGVTVLLSGSAMSFHFAKRMGSRSAEG